MDERRCQGLWIPVELLDRPELTIHEKVMAAEIDALDHPQHGCTAKNEHFERKMQLGERRIAEILSRLNDKGLIYYPHGKGNHPRRRRVIRSRLAQWVANVREAEARAADEFRARVNEVAELVHENGINGGRTNSVHSAESRTITCRIPQVAGVDTTLNENTLETTRDYQGDGLSPNGEGDILRRIEAAAEPAPATVDAQPPAPLAPEQFEAMAIPQPARRKGRPPKSGMMSAPLFGVPDDYGPTDDEIYMAYPRKAKRPRAIEQIVKAVTRLMTEYRRRGVANAEKTAREFLLSKTRAYAEYRAREIESDPRDAERFTPYPSTWFFNEEYLREFEASGARNNGQRSIRRNAEQRGQYPESRYGDGDNPNPYAA